MNNDLFLDGPTNGVLLTAHAIQWSMVGIALTDITLGLKANAVSQTD